MGKQKLTRWQTVTRAGILLGFAFLVAGFVVRDIRARGFVEADYIALGLWMAGAALTAGGIVLNYRMLLRVFSRRQTAEGLHLVLVVVLALALAALLCYITTRRYARMDWTGKQKYTLHSKTENILRSLDRDVKVTVLFQNTDPEMPLLAAHDMLEEFKALSPHIRVQELNHGLPESQRQLQELVQRLREDNIPAPSVIFAAGDRNEIVPFAKIATSSRGPMYPPDTFTGEEAFAGALIRLIDEEKTVLYALTGHGERPLDATAPPLAQEGTRGIMGDPRYSLSTVVKALARDNYKVEPLQLQVAGKVPDDCAVLIVAGPRAPLADSEIEAIHDYLDNRDGRAFIMVEPEVVGELNSNLEELLLAYGVRLRTDAVGVVEGMDIFGGRILVPAVPVDPSSLTNHSATADLSNFTIWLDQPCPIEIDNRQPGPMLRATELLTGVESSWGETDFDPEGEQDTQYDAGKDVSMPAVVGAAVQPARPPGQTPFPVPEEDLPGPKIVVIGSSLSFTNASVAQYPANRYLLQNSVNWMTGKMHLLGIPPKSLEFEPVPVPEGRIVAARYIFIGILPGCIVVLGIGVWLMRRR